MTSVYVFVDGELTVKPASEVENYRPEFVVPGNVTTPTTIEKHRQKFYEGWEDTLATDFAAGEVEAVRLLLVVLHNGETKVHRAEVFADAEGEVDLSQFDSWYKTVRLITPGVRARDVRWYGVDLPLIRKVLWITLMEYGYFARMSEKYNAEYGGLFYGATDFTFENLTGRKPNSGLNMEGVVRRMQGLFVGENTEDAVSGIIGDAALREDWENIAKLVWLYVRAGAAPAKIVSAVSKTFS